MSIETLNCGNCLSAAATILTASAVTVSGAAPASPACFACCFRISSKPVMSAESYCVTSGTVRPRRAEVLGRLAADAAHRLALDQRPTAEIGQRLGGRPRTGRRAGRRRRSPLIRRLACAFTSSIEIRPSSPVPATSSMSTPSSRAMRRTEGAAGADGPPDAGCVGTPVGRRATKSTTLSRWPALDGLRRRLGLARRGCAASAVGGALGRGRRRCGRRRRGGAGAVVLDAQDRLADLDLVAGLDLDVFDCAGDRRGHFDRRLVGFELEHRLILRQRVAGLHEHAQDIAGGDVLAQLGQA